MKAPLFLVLFLSASTINGQNTDSLVRTIKITYANHINQRNWFKRSERPAVDKLANNGHVVAYLKHDTLQFMVESYFSETGKTRAEYHFEKGIFVFKLEQRCTYNAPIYDSLNFDPEKMSIEENRYYFQQGQMILWMNEKNLPINQQSILFKDKEEEVLEEVKKLCNRD
jgi:hypothetical protein